MDNAVLSGNEVGGVRFRDPLRRLFACALVAVLFAGCATMEKKTPVAVSPAESPRIAAVHLADFVVGVGDTLQISVYRRTELAMTARVNSSGRIMFPLIGDVEAAGKGVFQLRDEIRSRLSRYLVNPQVSVAVTAVQSQKALVLGEVRTPVAQRALVGDDERLRKLLDAVFFERVARDHARVVNPHPTSSPRREWSGAGSSHRPTASGAGHNPDRTPPSR